MGGTRIPRILGIRNYLKNYFAMYKRLTRSRIQVELTSPPAWSYKLFEKLFFMYKLLTHSRIRVQLASRVYLRLEII